MASDSNPPINRLAGMAVGERPQERLERHGAPALSDTELLAMLLRSGTKGQDVVTLAGDLIARAGSLADLVKWSQKDFERHKGIGHVKALQLVTVMEISRRIIARGETTAPVLDDPAGATVSVSVSKSSGCSV